LLKNKNITSRKINTGCTNYDAPCFVFIYTVLYIKFRLAQGLKEFSKKTTKKGNFQFKGLPEGKCTVTFEKNYYQTLTVDSEIHNNAMTRLNVQLTKSE